MDTLFTISTEHGGWYYSIFYSIAFVVAYPILIYEGYRRKYPLLQWILIISSSLVFLIIGTKIFTYSGEDWNFIIKNLQFPITSNKTILGGIITGIIGILIARWWLRFKQPVLDSFAISLPVCMAIQRVGCLMTGCCFGKPTNIPWAIKYSINSIPYHIHLNNGWVDPLSDTSLAIHPTQLYQISYCLAIAMIIWIIRRFWKAPGNLFLSSITLYGLFLFISEFFRDPAADGIAGDVIWGLKYVQWGVLIFIITLSAIVFYREHTFRYKQNVHESYSINIYRNLILITFLTFITWIGKGWFTQLELTVLYIILLPGIAGVCWQIYRALITPSLRWLPLAIFASCILFMGLTFPDERKVKENYYTIKMGSSFGNFYNTIHYNPHESCLGTVYDEQIFKHKFLMGGIGISRSQVKGFNSLSYGLNLYSGLHRENKLDELPVNEFQIFGVNPFFRTDTRWIGIGIGVHIGELNLTLPYKPISQSYVTSGSDQFHLLPEFLVRLGPYDILDLEYKYGFQFPAPYPGLISQLSLGTGFGERDGTFLRFGVAFPTSNLFISGQTMIKDRYGFQFLCLYKNNYPEGIKQSQFVFGINYRFGFSEKPIVKEEK
jgi:phosphatidylglycerol:prolipoprotein diacylglycerol transferase